MFSSGNGGNQPLDSRLGRWDAIPGVLQVVAQGIALDVPHHYIQPASFFATLIEGWPTEVVGGIGVAFAPD